MGRTRVGPRDRHERQQVTTIDGEAVGGRAAPDVLDTRLTLLPATLHPYGLPWGRQLSHPNGLPMGRQAPAVVDSTTPNLRGMECCPIVPRRFWSVREQNLFACGRRWTLAVGFFGVVRHATAGICWNPHSRPHCEVSKSGC